MTESPQDAASQSAFLALLQQRDRLTGAINQLIETDFKDATVDLTKNISDIDSATTQLKNIGNGLAALQKAITIADTVVKVVASIISMVA